MTDFCPYCDSFVSAVGAILLALGIIALGLGLSSVIEVWRRVHKAKRLDYLESCLKCCFTVSDPDEFDCLVEYIELLSGLGFKSKEIHHKALAACMSNFASPASESPEEVQQ